MKRFLWLVFPIVFPAFLLAAVANAADEDNTESEILYLIQFVETSQCQFERNGTVYDSADAADHLQLKYRRGQRYADTAEHFIDRLASKSSFSGKPYFIQCKNTEWESVEIWLHKALDNYRHARG